MTQQLWYASINTDQSDAPVLTWVFEADDEGGKAVEDLLTSLGEDWQDAYVTKIEAATAEETLASIRQMIGDEDGEDEEEDEIIP